METDKRLEQGAETLPLEKTGSVMPLPIEQLLETEIDELDDDRLVDLTELVIDNLGIIGLEIDRALIFLERAKEGLSEDLRLGFRALLEAERNTGNLIYDRITGLAKEDPLRRGLAEAVKTKIEDGQLPPIYCIHLDVDGLHELNRLYGRNEVNLGFRKLTDCVVEEINKLSGQLPEDCSIYAFRKAETGDELLVFFVGLPRDKAVELKILAEVEWPVVQLGEKKVQFTATVTQARSDELEGKLSLEDKDRIGPALNGLEQLTEKRLSQLKKQRSIKR